MDPGGSSEDLRLSVPSAACVGKYRVLAELGSGGMANVYLAVMHGRNDFNKLVVLKIPRESVTEDPELLTMFLDEARLAARLGHRNVVQTYEVVEDAGRDVIVMEYLEGQTLNEILVRGRRLENPLPLDLHLRIVLEVLRGLHYAHELKDYDGRPLDLVHRDVSPHNVFVTFDGEVKVLDFGIAKAAISSHQTQVGAFKGKIRYMPPEQLAVEAIDRRADVFAAGAVLWEAAVGKKLWTGVSDSDVIANIASGAIPAPSEAKADVDPKLDAIVRKALAFTKEDRYATCRDLQNDLEALLAEMDARPLSAVAAHVSALFAEARSERARLIDEQLRRLSERAPPRIEVPSESSAGESGTPPGMSQAPPPPPDTRRRAIVLILTGALITVAALGALGFGRRATPASVSTSGAPAPPSEPAQPPAPVDVTLSFGTQPPEAKLFLDDEPLPSNPFTLTVKRDTRTHVLRIEATGHAKRTIPVVYDSDKELVLMLDDPSSIPTEHRFVPLKSAPHASANHGADAAAPSAAPSAVDASAPEPKPIEPKRPNRPIDHQL